jgi:hypothetical protein
MKFSDWLTDFSNALSSQKTAMDQLEDALNKVKSANSTLYSSLSGLGEIDLSDWFGSDSIDLSTQIDNYVDLDSLTANPITSILNEVSGMANLFNFELSSLKLKW